MTRFISVTQGLTHKGDIATESRAAAAGGVTSFMDMPNTKPPTVTTDALRSKLMRGRGSVCGELCFFIGATNDNLDTLLKTDFTRCPGVKLFLGSSTGNMLVDNEKVLNRIFARVPAVIAVHSEDKPPYVLTVNVFLPSIRMESLLLFIRKSALGRHVYSVPGKLLDGLVSMVAACMCCM